SNSLYLSDPFIEDLTVFSGRSSLNDASRFSAGVFSREKLSLSLRLRSFPVPFSTIVFLSFELPPPAIRQVQRVFLLPLSG
ncbi:hypothetical protein, partial [Escherichia coli]|uniref:hypothetical protein n=1 Tax=Escherichia coli TaxID=562 RepID=UPI001CDB1901